MSEPAPSLIEAFKRTQRDAETVERAVLQSTGGDSPQNDKHRITCEFRGLSGGTFAPMHFVVTAVHGYYGESGGYSDSSELLGRYFAKAVTLLAPTIMQRALSLSRADCETARKAAEDEARSVLGTISR